MAATDMPLGPVLNSAPTVEEVATVAGAADLFVLRRVEQHRFAHVGGVGQGAGWAGIVAISLADEPFFAAAVESGALARRFAGTPWHVFGPYYGRAVAVVPLSGDVVIVFGAADGALLELSERELRELAFCASESVGEVAAAKRLADELEVVNAIRDLLRLPAGGFDETLRGVVDHAREALSCDLGVLSVREPHRVSLSDPRGSITLAPGELGAVMDEIAARPDFPLCIQDALARPLPAPFSPADGVVAYYLLQLEEPLGGVLLLIHTMDAPRGFTLLCQSLGLRLLDAAGALFETALARDALRDELARSNQEARRDALTGLANRFAWDEATARFVCSGSTASIIQLDCRGLKYANEMYGRDVGDRLLRRVAEIAASCAGDDDLVARIGGDEFAILLARADERETEVLGTRILRALAEEPPIALSVRAAVVFGAATTRTGNLAAAQKDADTRVREAKRRAAAC